MASFNTAFPARDGVVRGVKFTEEEVLEYAECMLTELLLLICKTPLKTQEGLDDCLVAFESFLSRQRPRKQPLS